MITGTVYLMDEPRLDVLKSTLSNMYPPGVGYIGNTCICMDMDDADNMLEVWFPKHCQKATLLCPPPSAMYFQIDGHQEEFIQEYNNYLDYDSNVQEFLASILYFIHIGGHVILYTPSHLEDDAVWMNVLQLYFFTRYGITIGTSSTEGFAYDHRYDSVIADALYSNHYISVMEYAAYCGPVQSSHIQDYITMDMFQYCSPSENPLQVFETIKLTRMNTGILLKPALEFNT